MTEPLARVLRAAEDHAQTLADLADACQRYGQVEAARSMDTDRSEILDAVQAVRHPTRLEPS